MGNTCCALLEHVGRTVYCVWHQWLVVNMERIGHKQAIVVVWGQSVWWLQSGLGTEQAFLKFGENCLVVMAHEKTSGAVYF